jgi:hypothetical protein
MNIEQHRVLEPLLKEMKLGFSLLVYALEQFESGNESSEIMEILNMYLASDEIKDLRKEF